MVDTMGSKMVWTVLVRHTIRITVADLKAHFTETASAVINLKD